MKNCTSWIECTEQIQSLKAENEKLRAYNDNSMVNKRNIGDIILENKKLRKASIKIGSWLSAALDDPKACNEFKEDINLFFDAFDIKA